MARSAYGGSGIRWRRVAIGLGAGALAGATSLAVDFALARWMLGYAIHLRPPHVAAYLATGAAFGLVYGLVRHGASGRRVWGWSLLLCWAPPAIERVAIQSTALGVPASTQVALGLIGGLVILALAASHRAARIPVSLVVAAGLAAALGLAVHRYVFEKEVSLAALGLDALILLTVGLGWRAVRTPGAWRVASRAAVAACLGLLAMATRPSPLPPRVVSEAPDGAPNLILLVVDTLRWDVFRQVLETTPEGAAFLDRFGPAAHFDRVTAVAPWTVPSMATILTGMYPTQHGLGERTAVDPRLRNLDPDVPTLALRLRNRSYRTMAWVANPILYPGTGFDRGFDFYRLIQPATTRLPLVTMYKNWSWLDDELYPSADVVADQIAAALDELRAEAPFFLWLHLMDPHRPYRSHQGLTPPVGVGFPSEDDARYFGEVRFALGRLADVIGDLDTAGLWQSSAVVFASDHGEMFLSEGRDTGSRSPGGEPLDTGHGHGLYEELVRVPLLVRPAGGLETPLRFDHPVSHVDLYETFGDLLGLDLKAATETRSYSLAPWLAGHGDVEARRRPWSISGFLQYAPLQRTLVGLRMKIIDFEGDRVEMFDLGDDPFERLDLSAERPEALAEA